MDVIYTITGGAWFRDSFNAVAAFTSSNNWEVLVSMATTLSVCIAVIAYIRTHDLMTMVKWAMVFVMVGGVLLGIKRPVQIIDLSDSTAVYRVNNVPVGLVLPASLVSRIGHGLVLAYETVFHQPDAFTYSKYGMLFGAKLVRDSHDMTLSGSDANQLLPAFVQNCVLPDIMLNKKYTFQQLFNAVDTTIIFNPPNGGPSPLRGVYNLDNTFTTCAVISPLLMQQFNSHFSFQGNGFREFVGKVFPGKGGAMGSYYAPMLSRLVGDSYSYFGLSSAGGVEILRKNVTMSMLRKGITTDAARSGDTAGLVNLSSEVSYAKMRMSQATGANIATRTLPLMQTILFGMLIGLFPVVILLAIMSVLTVEILKGYVIALVYLQMWPVLFAILNNAMNFYLKENLKGFQYTLSNMDELALQTSDIAVTAGWLSISIPFLALAIVKGLAGAASQAGSALGSMIQSTASQSSSQTVDGTWAFNNMQTDNVTGGKWDTNFSYANGQMTTQGHNGALTTTTADGQTVYNTAPAMSKLPVDINFGKAMSSTAQRLARESETQAESSLSGYNHAVNSAFNQARQFSTQSGNSSTMTSGADSSQATTQTKGVNMMMSAAKSLAARENISEQDAFNKLMDASQRDEFNAGFRGGVGVDSDRAVLGKLAGLAFGAKGNGEVYLGGSKNWSDNETDSTNHGNTKGTDHTKDRTSQELADFRQGKDMVQNYRSSVSGSHADNTANTMLEQLGTTLSVADSNYSQYTSSLTRSHEYSQMASTSDTTSGNMQSNYAQEFVGYVRQHAPDKADSVLTDTASPSARAEREQLVGEFMETTMRSRVEGMYEQKMSTLSDDMSTVGKPAATGNAAAQGDELINQRAQQTAIQNDTADKVNTLIENNNKHIHDEGVSIDKKGNGIIRDRDELQNEHTQASSTFDTKHAAAVQYQKDRDKDPIDHAQEYIENQFNKER